MDVTETGDLADIGPNFGLLFVRVLSVDMRPFEKMRYSQEVRQSAKAIIISFSHRQMALHSNSSLSEPC